MTVTSALILTVGLATPAPAPVAAATQSSVAANPDRSPGNARMSDGVGKQVEALELEAAFAPSLVLGDAANPRYQESYSRWGVAGTISFTYRARYFLNPHIEAGYAWLASGDSQLPPGIWGEGGSIEQSLTCWTISPGATLPFWRFRLLAGIGIVVAEQANIVFGEENESSQLGMLQRLGLSFDALKTERTRLAAVLEYQNSAGLKLSWLTLGVSFRGDFVQWD
jgi:hypothetical protein